VLITSHEQFGAVSPIERNKSGSDEPWQLRLYIAGWTPASIEAVRNVKLLESEYLPQGSTVEIIDVVQQPALAHRDNILAIPTVVRVHPLPVRRMLGNLGDIAKARKALGLD
jgi:circadian clock protein KaiB